MTWILAALLAQQISTDDVVRMTREGRTESEILRSIGSASFQLSSDDVVSLQRAGVSQTVLGRMIAGPGMTAQNRAHSSVRIRVNGRTIEVGAGEELAPGASIRLPGSGEYEVTVDGRPRELRVKAPAALTFRGSSHEEFEVVTLYVEDASGTDTCMIRSRITPTVEHREVLPPPYPYPIRYPRVHEDKPHRRWGLNLGIGLGFTGFHW
jgi:hypothetical protein